MSALECTNGDKEILLILTDTFSSRILLSCGIIRKLMDKLKGSLRVVSLFDISSTLDFKEWIAEDDRVTVHPAATVMGVKECTIPQDIHRRLDAWLEKYIGFVPMGVRFNLLNGFGAERMAKHHRNGFYDLCRSRPFGRSRLLFKAIFAWYYSRYRFVHPSLTDYMRHRASALVVSNLQFRTAQPYLLAAYRLNVPIVGYIGSWDHPVGKGVVFPHCDTYIVQNAFMKDALIRYHNIGPDRIVQTGWPQTDGYAARADRKEYVDLLNSYGLDPGLPCILFAGNTEINAPYEPHFVERLGSWWESKGGAERCSIIFRPHPMDMINERWKTRFASVLNRRGLYVQTPSFSDVNVLRTLLQSVDAVVTNAGTILLDSLINDRPVVCVLYDEGAPPGSRFAVNNVSGLHYRDLMDSGAFHKAHNFDEVIVGLERSLSCPDELSGERSAICGEAVGEVDGMAGSRVVGAIMAGLPAA